MATCHPKNCMHTCRHFAIGRYTYCLWAPCSMMDGIDKMQAAGRVMTFLWGVNYPSTQMEWAGHEWIGVRKIPKLVGACGSDNCGSPVAYGPLLRFGWPRNHRGSLSRQREIAPNECICSSVSPLSLLRPRAQSCHVNSGLDIGAH